MKVRLGGQIRRHESIALELRHWRGSYRLFQDVAQLGRAFGSGPKGRWFDSTHPDMKIEWIRPGRREGFAYYGVSLLTRELEIHFQTLPKKDWYFGRDQFWYDGPVKMFGLGFCEFQWNRPF